MVCALDLSITSDAGRTARTDVLKLGIPGRQGVRVAYEMPLNSRDDLFVLSPGLGAQPTVP